jgi:type I restriction enzyme S subunit
MNKEILISTLIDEISMGPFGSDIKVDNFINVGVPVLNGSNLVGYKLTENSFRYVSEEKANTYGKAIAKRGDIVITHRGTLGQISFIPTDSKFEKYVISQSQFRVRFNDKKVSSQFIVYLFHTEYGQKKLLSFKNHVGVPALAQATTNFKALKLTLPDLTIQQKIASVLSKLDDKIELNNKINDNLEQMAKTLYDYWFVQFDFADENGKPYKSSGGKMVWNEVLKRNIPEGWKYTELSDALTIKYGKDHKKLNEGSIPVYGSGGIMKYVDTSIYDKEAILIPRKGSIGNLFYIAEPFWSVDTMFYATPSVQGSTLYYFHQLSKLKLETLNVGTAVPSLTIEILNRIKLLVSDSDVMLKFNSVVFKNQNQIYLLNKQNQQLSSLRDWLLPMLMNGQVKVE